RNFFAPGAATKLTWQQIFDFRASGAISIKKPYFYHCSFASGATSAP
ncbi:hypothetical protein A2U01_0094130, partial [Trifolium medium]|nr:hypothetical protein [Trifolium medium]